VRYLRNFEMLEISPDSQLLTVSWVVPVCSEPIQAGCVVITGEKIEYVGQLAELANLCSANHFRQLSEGKIDYANSVLVPGLINLHTHLDYSCAQGLSGAGGMFEWMKELVASGSAKTAVEWQAAAHYGASQSALAGTTCVVDSSFTGNSLDALAAVGLRGVVGLELFGGNEDLAPTIWQQWLEKRKGRLDTGSLPVKEALAQGRIQLTVAPHAPYTVSPRLWRLAHEWAQSEKLPITAHLAESWQECAWIKDSNSELDGYLAFIRSLYAGGASSLKEYDYLKEVRDTAWKGHGLSPVQHLRQNELLGKNLLAVHAVHVDHDDIELLAANEVKVAHCPRSNSKLGNGRAPLSKWLAAGLKVGFGTDSLASTDDLSMINEVRAAQTLHRGCQPDFLYDDAQALRALTLGAAEIIGLSSIIGSLAPGKRADLAVFALDLEASCPLSALFHDRSRVLDLFVDGRRIVENGRLTSTGVCAQT
jgi:cytosine/adenosine deaminase-related metal-dependent hydrolase